MESHTRAMTQAEIAFLKETYFVVVGTDWSTKMVLFLLIWPVSFGILCILAIPLSGLDSIPLRTLSPMMQQTVLVVMAFVAAMVICLWRGRAEKSRHGISPAADAIAKGMVREQEFTVTSCYRFEDFDEDYGDGNVGYLFALSDDRVLSVMGWDLRERDDLPSTRIRYATTLTGDLRVGIEPIGESLEPTGIVQITKQHFKPAGENAISYAGPEDGVFYSGSMEQVLERYALQP